MPCRTTIALQQQLSKTRAEIKQLQQAKRHSNYPNNPGTSINFRITDGQIICRRWNRVWYFARFPHASNTLVVIRTKDLVMQAMKHRNICIHSQRVTTLTILGDTTNHRITFIPDSQGNQPLPTPQFGNQPNEKYQGKTSNIPGHYSRNYSNVIQNHALQEYSHRIK